MSTIALRHVLVPTDFSECSAVALRYGLALAQRLGRLAERGDQHRQRAGAGRPRHVQGAARLVALTTGHPARADDQALEPVRLTLSRRHQPAALDREPVPSGDDPPRRLVHHDHRAARVAEQDADGQAVQHLGHHVAFRFQHREVAPQPQAGPQMRRQLLAGRRLLLGERFRLGGAHHRQIVKITVLVPQNGADPVMQVLRAQPAGIERAFDQVPVRHDILAEMDNLLPGIILFLLHPNIQTIILLLVGRQIFLLHSGTDAQRARVRLEVECSQGTGLAIQQAVDVCSHLSPCLRARRRLMNRQHELPLDSVREHLLFQFRPTINA